jgi:hypothetical protein
MLNTNYIYNKYPGLSLKKFKLYGFQCNIKKKINERYYTWPDCTYCTEAFED